MLDVPYKYMVVSINGTPNSWMIYNGTPILGNHHMLVYWRLTIYNFRVVDVFRTRKCVNNSFIYSTRFSTSFHFIVLQLMPGNKIHVTGKYITFRNNVYLSWMYIIYIIYNIYIYTHSCMPCHGMQCNAMQWNALHCTGLYCM
jgi:hypothetical protein